MRYAAANDTELFDHVQDLYVEVGDNHLQVFFVISWLLHHQLDLLKDKIYRVQGRIQDLEMERNDTRVRVARLESHKSKTNEHMRTLTGLVYEVSQSYLELSWLFLTIGFQLQASRHLQGEGSVDCPYELLEDTWGVGDLRLLLLLRAVPKLVPFAWARIAPAWLLLVNGPVVGRHGLAGRGE